jgi:hypothetical protein
VPILTTAIILLTPGVVKIRTLPLLIALALAPSAPAQTGTTTDRIVAPAVAPAAAHSDALDHILALVEPAPAESPAHPERFREFVLSTVGPVPLIGEAAGAAIGQWMNTPKEWGQGWDALGKRYWSNLAYNGIRQTITYGGSLALREDTRYFASRRSGFWPRARHAVVGTFTARHANGRDSFSYSATAGVIGAAAISSAWGPKSWKGPGNIAENSGISFASTAVSNVVREFLPDIFHRARK